MLSGLRGFKTEYWHGELAPGAPKRLVALIKRADKQMWENP